MSAKSSWVIAGSYYESCNCLAVCPCRRLNGESGGDSNYGLCQFVLSWWIRQGQSRGIELAGLKVAMAGFYEDAIAGKPWTIKLFIDEIANDEQFGELQHIFLGRAQGNMAFTSNIATIVDVERAAVALGHEPGHEKILIGNIGSSRAIRKASYDGTVTCGIPGHDRPGTEYVAELSMRDGPFQWDYEERCGFATNFEFRG